MNGNHSEPNGPPAAHLTIAPLELTPGVPARAVLGIVNPTDRRTSYALEIAGLDPTWVRAPQVVGPLRPGHAIDVAVDVMLPIGHPSARLVATATLRPLDARPGEPDTRPVSADIVLVVGDGLLIRAALQPAAVYARRRGQLDLVMHNRSGGPLRVDLTASTPSPHLTLAFDDPSPVLPPGHEVRIRTRIRAPRPTGRAEVRHPFSVRVQGRTTPVLLEGSFVQKPVVPFGLTRLTAIIAVIALWTAVAVVGITALANHYKKSATDKSVAGAPPTTAPAKPSGFNSAAAGTGSGGGGSGGGGSAGGANAGGAKSGGSGSTGGRSSPTTTATTEAGAAPPTTTAASQSATAAQSATASAPNAIGAPGTTRASGKVSSAGPGGVTVTMALTSLVDEAAQGANFASQTTGGRTVIEASKDVPIGKVYGSLADTTLDAATTNTPPLTTTTTPDGSWAFAGLRAPDYYLATFSKPGYITTKYIVTTTTASGPVLLNTTLAPGNGEISGSVFGPDGPLGGVSLTITDGTNTLTTRTPTVGAVGTWHVGGLSTPDTYLVSATTPGFGTQISIVTLTAGQVVTGVNLTMKSGVGSISGIVTAARTGQPVGGVTVTASDGTTSLTATTLTVNPVGTFILPNLPVPGTYALTVSGPGWLTATQQVTLTGNAVVNTALTASTADLTGIVSDSKGVGLAGAGAVLSNDTFTFKTLSQSTAPIGHFDFGQVPPGQYVLTVEDFEYSPASVDVTLAPGDIKTVDVHLTFVGPTNDNTATIEGTVEDLFNQKPVSGATVTLDGDATTAVTTNTNGTYRIPNVPPGAHTVTATATGFESASVTVSVALGSLTFAPTILLPILDKVAGIVISNAGGVVADPVATLVNSQTGQTYTGVAPTLSGIPPADQGGFEIDDVPHGNYQLTISGPPGAGYDTLTEPVTLNLDTNLLLTGPLSPALNLLPRFSVITLIAQSGAPPTATGGVTVTLTDTTTGTTLPAATSPAPPDPLIITGLTAGDSYSAAFSDTISGVSYSAAPVTFTGVLNNITIDSVVLAPAFPTVTVALTFPWQTPAGTIQCPVVTTVTGSCPAVDAAPGQSLPTVQMTGVTGYSFPLPGQPGSPQTQTVTATSSGGGVWTFPAVSFLPSPVTFTVIDPNGTFQLFTATADPTIAGFSSQNLVLAPTPTPVAGTISPPSGVTVAVAPALSTLAVSDQAGALTWVDQGAGGAPGAAQPGIYDVSFSAPGYDSATDSGVVVPLCNGTCPTITINASLVRHVSLTVTPSWVAIGGGVAGPTVELFDRGAVASSFILGAPGQSAVFNDLSVADSTYQVVIEAPGYGRFTQAVTLSPTNPNVLTPTLAQQGVIRGTISGVINATTAPLAGARVSATLISGACPADQDNPAAVTTNSAGGFTLINNPATTVDGGLCLIGVYQVTATATGYATNQVTVDFVSGDVQSSPISLTANKLTQTIVVTDPSGATVSTATVTAFSSVGTSPITGTTSDHKTFTFQVDPAPYIYTIQAPGYETLQVGPVPYTPGVAPPTLTEQINVDANTITGQVLTPGPSGSLVPIGAGAEVDLFPTTVGAPRIATATTDASGVYTISQRTDGTPVTDGSYVLGVVFAGYTFVPPSPASFSTTFPTTVENARVTANPVALSVAVSSTVSGVNANGATLTLTPASPPGGQSLVCAAAGTQLSGLGQGTTQSATITTGTASFSTVAPDFYQVSVTGTGIPAQSSTGLVVCPSAGTNPAPATFTVQEGQISGTVTVPTGFQASGVTLNVFTGGSVGGSPTATPTISCSNGPCTTGTYSVLVGLGSNYTLQASQTGFQSATSTTATLTSGSPTATFSPTLTALTHSVDITVTSTNGSLALAGAAVTLTTTTPAHTYNATADATGVASFTDVAPNQTQNYTVTATLDGVTASGSVQVPVQSLASDPIAGTASGSAGVLHGSLNLNPNPTGALNVTVDFCVGAANCATPAFTQTVSVGASGNGTYRAFLPAASYFVDASATGYTAANGGPTALDDGGNVTGPAIALAP